MPSSAVWQATTPLSCRRICRTSHRFATAFARDLPQAWRTMAGTMPHFVDFPAIQLWKYPMQPSPDSGDATPLPPPAAPAAPAAQYVRMSTEHQQYSTSNQEDTIKQY